MTEYITDHTTPCRPCRGTGWEDTGHGRKVVCLDCGGSKCKSVRVDQRDPVATAKTDVSGTQFDQDAN